ncbi:pyridoxine/pyridoxamine 5'-phosphate oxidase-like isoform X2 [Lineus longissimus]|uniref:pyridoxine/pyridoxamine 5'-phosphate oxidase-like isoform X2 n=1 Tax=Lineus longissimus TaxID=88925 RepID=UPI002B4E264D
MGRLSIFRQCGLVTFYRHPASSFISSFIHSRISPSSSRFYYTISGSDNSMSKDIDVAAMRKPYRGSQDIFDTKDLAALDPFDQFSAWFTEACKVPSIKEANAMSLATANKEGHPSVRMVLLKGYDKTGFKFFTNYGSRKASELTENPHASLMFYWEAMMRVVRIEGVAEKLSVEESTEYFHSRPRSSQIGAIVSQQSSVVESRSVLDKRNEELMTQYEDESVHIPKPDHWGGYKVVPRVIEFWQGQTNRLHDRLVFRRQRNGEILDEKVSQVVNDGWILERLAP